MNTVLLCCAALRCATLVWNARCELSLVNRVDLELGTCGVYICPRHLMLLFTHLNLQYAQKGQLNRLRNILV